MGKKEKFMVMPVTGLVVMILVILLGIYDLVALVIFGSKGSVSNWMIQAGFNSPMIVFAIGFVSGHLFGYMKLETKESK